MHGLMSGDWKRGTVSGPQRLQLYAWTAPDLSTTAPALDSDPLSAPTSLGRWTWLPGCVRHWPELVDRATGSGSAQQSVDYLPAPQPSVRSESHALRPVVVPRARCADSGNRRAVTPVGGTVP